MRTSPLPRPPSRAGAAAAAGAMSTPTAWRATLLKALKSNAALPNAKYVQLV